MRPSAGARNVRALSGDFSASQGTVAALGLASGAAKGDSKTDPRIAAFERELERRRAEREDREDELAEKTNAKDVDVFELEEELEERRITEENLSKELEELRAKLDKQEELAQDELYVAEIEAQVSALRFENLAMQENYVEMKKSLDLAMEKSSQLDEVVERSQRMEEYLLEVEQERNSLHEQLEVANGQVQQLAARLVQNLPSEAQAEEKSKAANEERAALALAQQELAEVRQQLAQRDTELARQGEVLRGFREGAQRLQKPATSAVTVSEPRTSLRSTAEVVLNEDARYTVVPFDPSLADVFVQLVRSHFEQSGERIALSDKKVFRDVQGTLVAGGGNVLFLRNVQSGEIEACFGLVAGVGCFDVKYLGGVHDATEGTIRLQQLVLHASKWAHDLGADHLIALFPGSRADAENYWGTTCGFKFVGVGPAPSFAVRLAREIK